MEYNQLNISQVNHINSLENTPITNRTEKELKDQLESLFRQNKKSTKKLKKQIQLKTSKRRSKIISPKKPLKNLKKISTEKNHQSSTRGIRQNILASIKQRFKNYKDHIKIDSQSVKLQGFSHKSSTGGTERLRKDLKNSKIFSKIFHKKNLNSENRRSVEAKLRPRVSSIGCIGTQFSQRETIGAIGGGSNRNFVSPRKRQSSKVKLYSDSSSKFLLGNTLNDLLEADSQNKNESKNFRYRSISPLKTKLGAKKLSMGQINSPQFSTAGKTERKKKINRLDFSAKKKRKLTETELILSQDNGLVGTVPVIDKIYIKSMKSEKSLISKNSNFEKKISIENNENDGIKNRVRNVRKKFLKIFFRE